MSSVSLQYNPSFLTPRLPELPLYLVDALADMAAAYATSWKNNTFNNSESFNWIPGDSVVDTERRAV